ncbi:MAG: DUF11 domain-containing protein, partial [Microbacteriaceae bacterium]|nr:DUF11 domain-containing protein [Microbacteriaceae bacterium]
MTHARRSTARPHRTALRGRLAALLALTIALAGGGTAPAAVAAPGDLGVSIDFVSADSPFAPIDSLAATILSGDSNAGANNYNFRYNVGYTCGPVACTDVEIHIAPQPLDPAYSYYRFAVYQSTSLPAGATIAPGGSATAGYTIRLGDLAPSTSGSFQMLYRYQQRQPGSDPASFFPDGTAIPATATISAAGLDPVTASDSIVWHIVTPDPGVRIVAGNARIGVPYTYTYYMSAGCQWVRSTAGHGEPGKLCAADYLVTAQLPAGAVIQSASDGGIVDPVANTVTWSAAGRGAAIGWGPLNSLGSPRTVTVVFPEASVPSDPGACIIDASTTLTADLTYLDGAAKSATTTATNLVNACEPFALASLDYKDTTTSNSSANLVAPNGNSTGTVLGGTSGNYWEVQVSNRSNVPGVATIVDEDLEQADLPVYRIWTDAGPADFRFTLEDVVSGDRTDAEALGVSNYQAPAGTRIVAATVVTAPIAGPNLEASSTPNRVSAHVRFYYTVPADAAVPLQGFSRTNTVSASMQYPDTGLADLDLGTRTGTVTVAPRPARFSATLSRTSAGGDPVPGDLVTFGGRGTSSSIRGGAVIEPQYVFAAPAGWTIDSVAALPPGVTAGPIHAVTIAGVVRQVVVFEIDPAAMSPAVADMNQAWPLVSVVATPTPAVVAGSASRADLYFTDASNTFNETNAGFVSGVVDADDLDGDGLTDERYANANASVRIGVISGIVVTKEICTGPGTDEGCVWSATSGSSVAVPPTATDIRYRVTLQNGPTPLTNVVAYDVLPHPGDHGLLPGGAPRGSTFAEEVTSITADPGVLLAYSASTEPCRTVDPALVEPACTDDWDEPTTEMLAIRATVASLAAGQQVRFSYAAAVLGSPAAGARACNAVAVVATGLSATETAPVCAEIVSADLAISVPDRLPLQEDRAGLVPFDVVNNGGTDGAPGTVEIEVPLGVTVTSLDPEGWTCDTAGGATAPLEGPAVLACTPVPGTLPLGAPLRLELPVIPDVIADELCFPAHVAGTLHDPVPANNDADACFASLPWAPGIAISKDDGRAAAAVGDELTYTIRVSNLLVAETLGGAVVTDTLPDGLVFVAADHGGTVSGQNPVDAYGDQTGGTVTWTLPDLGPTGTPGPDGADGAGAAGSALDLTVTVRVSPLADDDLVNLAEVSVPDPADTATTLGDESSDTDGLRLLGIAKQSSAPVSGVDSGDVVEYRILLANVGTAAFDASAPATIVDDLGEVLDDATLVPGSVQLSVDAGTPVALADPAGGLLEWSGPLPVGSTAVLSYRVQVRDDGDGDHE